RNRVGDGHEGCMQQPGDPANDADTDEGGEHEHEDHRPIVKRLACLGGFCRVLKFQNQSLLLSLDALASASLVRECTTWPAWVMRAPCCMSSERSRWNDWSLVNAWRNAVRFREKRV